jgi:hypothetical protein
LVLEGKVIGPWAAELRTAYQKTRADLNGRKLVIDLKHITAINQEGENVLFELMSERGQILRSGCVHEADFEASG